MEKLIAAARKVKAQTKLVNELKRELEVARYRRLEAIKEMALLTEDVADEAPVLCDDIAVEITAPAHYKPKTW